MVQEEIAFMQQQNPQAAAAAAAATAATLNLHQQQQVRSRVYRRGFRQPGTFVGVEENHTFGL